jgi:chromosome segregation ATPase
MQSMKVALCLLCIVAPTAADTNPLATVVSLLDDLQAKIEKEGVAEAKAYKEYQAWCDDTAANTGFAIKTATSDKEKLEATIAKAVSDGEAASSKIEELGAALATNDADLTSATQIRKKEATEFAASEAELADIVDTLGRAINVLSREMAKKSRRIRTGEHNGGKWQPCEVTQRLGRCCRLRKR